MRLYHYLETRWALDDITKNRIKLSKLDELNDPYELRCVRSRDPRLQSALIASAEDIVKQYGLLCMSRTNSSVLMWSHYSDKHRGICLGFDVDDEITRPVEYFAEPVTAAFDTLNDALATVDRLVGGKYSGWAYEEEVRFHGTREETDEETGQFFVALGGRTRLREVIAGAKFPFRRQVIESALDMNPGRADVRILKASVDEEKFRVVVSEDWPSDSV